MDPMHPIQSRHSATHVVANKPVLLVQPSYVKRNREVDNGDQECIKRLCSLVSGARDTRQGVYVNSGASPEFNVFDSTDTDPRVNPNNGRGGCTLKQPGDLDGSVVDRATDDVTLTAHASASDAAPDRTLATTGGLDACDLAAPGVATPGGSSAPIVASANAPATAPATAAVEASFAAATAMPSASARGVKGKASDDSSEILQELRGKQPKRVRLSTKQHSSLYRAPCEH